MRIIDVPVVPRVVMLPFGTRAVHVLERNLTVYRHAWLVFASGVIEPLVYLLGIGVGLAPLIGSIRLDEHHTVGYALFVAPAMMATSAMNGSIFDSTFNMFFKLKVSKIYDALLATPAGVFDIATGEITWALARGSVYALSFVIVMAALGLVTSPWGVLAVPAAILTGFTFAAAGTAATTFMRSWQDFDLVVLATLPLFLFSATFFPLSAYPGPLQVIVQLTPLYHSVNLVRSLTTGTVGCAQLWDVAYLLGMGAVCVGITSRRLGKLLLR